MWIFTELGFLSIVRDNFRPGHLLVRARQRDDAVKIADVCSAIASRKIVILETPERDYRFRMSVPIGVISEVIAVLVEGIDYANFKDRVHEIDPDPERSIAYTRVWCEMSDFQRIINTKPPKVKLSSEQRRIRKKNKVNRKRR